MKKIKYLLFTFISLSLFNMNVFAASYDVTVTSSSVTVGNTITLKIKGNDLAGRFNISSSNTGVLTVSESKVWVDNNTVSVKVTTKKVGSAKITVTASDVTASNGSSVTGSKTVSITVKEVPKIVPKVKSTNNYLSNLSVNGYELDKKFNKETLEYNVNIEPDVEKIKINAQLADSSASVNGTGEKTVSVGTNKFEIIVTAENGSKRTYILNVIKKDYDPIKVTVDGKEMTVIRKKNDLPKVSDYFVDKKVSIGDDIVDGYYAENMDYTLVGLRDNDSSYLYLIRDNKYTIYKEYTFNGVTVRYLDKEVTGGVKRSNFRYGDSLVTAYQNVKLDLLKNTYALDDNDIDGNQFYLFYGINLENGHEELYQYDAKEKTIQRFNMELLNLYKDRSDTYYLYLLVAVLLLGVNIILLGVLGVTKKKNKKVKNGKKKDKNERKEDE